MSSKDDEKRRAAARSLEFVEAGMRLGLGSGSTAAHMVRLLGERVRAGLKVIGVPTSEATRALASEVGIPLATLEEAPELDLTIDGADEVDPAGRLIKGGGGALLREKIVASASRRMVVIADAAKQVKTLGRFPLPVEVIPFASRPIWVALSRLGGQPTKRYLPSAPGRDFVTDEGNLIYDCPFGAIADPVGLARALADIPGVVEHGLFIGLASVIIIGSEDGVTVTEVEA